MIAPAHVVQVLGLLFVLLVAGCPSSQVNQAPPPPNMIGADAGRPAGQEAETGHSTIRILPRSKASRRPFQIVADFGERLVHAEKDDEQLAVNPHDDRA